VAPTLESCELTNIRNFRTTGTDTYCLNETKIALYLFVKLLSSLFYSGVSKILYKDVINLSVFSHFVGMCCSGSEAPHNFAGTTSGWTGGGWLSAWAPG